MGIVLPEVSIILPVYNGENFLDECLMSISQQTFENFECIIVDDGSTDATKEIITKWEKEDKRFRALYNHENRGKPYSRNRALLKSKANLIALQDADDVSLPNRLSLQVEIMNECTNVQILGSYILIYENNKIVKQPLSNEDIRAGLLFNSNIFNPTVMYRKSILFENHILYSKEFPVAQDYALWGDLIFVKEAIFMNIDKPLVRYRIHPNVDRKSYVIEQSNLANFVRYCILKRMNILFSDEEFNCHLSLQSRRYHDCTYDECIDWCRKLIRGNNFFNITTEYALKNHLNYRLKRLDEQSFTEKMLV